MTDLKLVADRVESTLMSRAVAGHAASIVLAAGPQLTPRSVTYAARVTTSTGTTSRKLATWAFPVGATISPACVVTPAEATIKRANLSAPPEPVASLPTTPEGFAIGLVVEKRP
jgi:hypothetical protein